MKRTLITITAALLLSGCATALDTAQLTWHAARGEALAWTFVDCGGTVHLVAVWMKERRLSDSSIVCDANCDHCRAVKRSAEVAKGR